SLESLQVFQREVLFPFKIKGFYVTDASRDIILRSLGEFDEATKRTSKRLRYFGNGNIYFSLRTLSRATITIITDLFSECMEPVGSKIDRWIDGWIDGWIDSTKTYDACGSARWLVP
ncbi:hypothetical protein V1478_000653, partial [Vespula squamosa]